MSNFLAVATVTATLRSILANALAEDHYAADVQVTTLRPDLVENDPLTAGVNIYLYQATPDAYARNDDLPTRRPDGRVMTRRPSAAVDLHYLLSFYGNESQLLPQRLLGSVVRTLHAQPILSAAEIEAVVASTSFLTGSDLASAVERVRFTPVALSLEDLSKLWSVFYQAKYVLSVAYQASLVLLTAEGIPVVAPPVRQPVVTAQPTVHVDPQASPGRR
jgi:hypothetical protein